MTKNRQSNTYVRNSSRPCKDTHFINANCNTFHCSFSFFFSPHQQWCTQLKSHDNLERQWQSRDRFMSDKDVRHVFIMQSVLYCCTCTKDKESETMAEQETKLYSSTVISSEDITALDRRQTLWYWVCCCHCSSACSSLILAASLLFLSHSERRSARGINVLSVWRQI